MQDGDISNFLGFIFFHIRLVIICYVNMSNLREIVGVLERADNVPHEASHVAWAEELGHMIKHLKQSGKKYISVPEEVKRLESPLKSR